MQETRLGLRPRHKNAGVFKYLMSNKLEYQQLLRHGTAWHGRLDKPDEVRRHAEGIDSPLLCPNLVPDVRLGIPRVSGSWRAAKGLPCSVRSSHRQAVPGIEVLSSLVTFYFVVLAPDQVAMRLSEGIV